jgi:hypothetical protein
MSDGASELWKVADKPFPIQTTHFLMNCLRGSSAIRRVTLFPDWNLASHFDHTETIA